jgi:hypothetical protein
MNSRISHYTLQLLARIWTENPHIFSKPAQNKGYTQLYIDHTRNRNLFDTVLYRGADKSLARPGRKQATSVSKSSWKMNPTRSRKMPSCLAIDLAEIRRSSKISSWIWSIISGMVGLRTYQHPGYMTFDGTQFLTILILFIKYSCFWHAKCKCNNLGYVKSHRKYTRLLLIAVLSRLLLNQ